MTRLSGVTDTVVVEQQSNIKKRHRNRGGVVGCYALYITVDSCDRPTKPSTTYEFDIYFRVERGKKQLAAGFDVRTFTVFDGLSRRITSLYLHLIFFFPLQNSSKKKKKWECSGISSSEQTWRAWDAMILAALCDFFVVCGTYPFAFSPSHRNIARTVMLHQSPGSVQKQRIPGSTVRWTEHFSKGICLFF